MQEIDIEVKGGNKEEIKIKNNNASVISGAIIIAGIIIGGAILLKDSKPSPTVATPGIPPTTTLAPIDTNDRVLGNPQAKVTLVMYEDFQCPFCGKFFSESESNIRATYVQDGTVKLVYRDFAFLGPESEKAAEAAHCAGDQGKFWEYHDYLFNHQNGENQGNFADPHLKDFAKALGLNTSSFNSCLDSNKYERTVAFSKDEATKAGVKGTPKGFILKNGETVATIDGAEPYAMVKPKIDAALK